LKSWFDKLNLRPGERRLVVFVGITVFVLLNAFFVWPQFFEWGKLKRREREAQTNLEKYQREVDHIPQYTRRLAELEKAGASVPSEDQALKLATTISSQAVLSSVFVSGTDPTPRATGGTTRTNLFFEEQTSSIRVTTEEKALVDFLYNLGAGSSMIRVRQMSLSPDPPQQRLVGSLTLVASYAKKAPPKVAPTTAPSRTNAPVKVAAATTGKTNTPTVAAKAESKWRSYWPFGKSAAAGSKTVG